MAKTSRWKVEVVTDGSGKWVERLAPPQVYNTKKEAELAAVNLATSWMEVRKWRVVEVEPDPRLDRGTRLDPEEDK